MAYNFKTGRRSAINTSGIPLTNSDHLCNGILVQSNGVCWVGPSDMDFSDDLYPWVLASGVTTLIPTRHTGDIYVKAPNSGVIVYWITQ